MTFMLRFRAVIGAAILLAFASVIVKTLVDDARDNDVRRMLAAQIQMLDISPIRPVDPRDPAHTAIADCTQFAARTLDTDCQPVTPRISLH
ncbi:MAG: hypothetical protein AAFW98_16230 [Pseudomonadota bacterium]